jgi:dipeptidyl aminopeptidase/acylaminoacyl peptidase
MATYNNPSDEIQFSVPMIDREIFFDNPEISRGQLSPDAQWISFLKPLDGVMNIWVKKFDEPFENARALTAEVKRPISAYFWTYDGKYVLFVKDQDGDENYLVYAVDPMAFPEEGQKVPNARNITDARDSRAYIIHVSKKNPDIMFIGLNDRDKSWHDLYEVKISTGERKLTKENNERLTSFNLDWDENIRLASRSNEDGTSEILKVDGDKLKSIYKTTVFEQANIIGFTKDNKYAYLITNRGNNDLTRLMILNPDTGEETHVEEDPDGLADFGSAYLSEITREIIYTSYTDSKTRRYFKDKNFEKFYQNLKSHFPGKEISLNNSDITETKWLISVWSDNDPGAVYYVDMMDPRPKFQYRPRPKLNPEHLAKMKVIGFKSSDELEIPGYLTLPVGIDAKNLPMIVMPHGGPWARDYWGYNSYAQFLSNRGYAILLINFRGSTGFGKSFLNAGNGEWGQLMQDDITWGVRHMIDQGIADPDRIAIMGGSYGGYATLAGVAFTPDLFKAAVSIVGPSNLITLLNSIPPYWEAFRKVMYYRMADLNTDEGRDLLMRQSPLNSVDKIKTPLLVVQGANDPRVKKAESNQIVIAMRDKNLPVEYICADDEGHGFARPINNMAFLAKTEEFLAKHLGGRYQKEMADDVAARLQEITVDISTLELVSTVNINEL